MLFSRLFRLVVLVFSAVTLFTTCGRTPGTQRHSPNSDFRAQRWYDTSTLSGFSPPLAMPYNRVVEPAGKSVYFGLKGVENHALDCALSPDGRVLAVKSRYELAFVDANTGQLISEFKWSDNENFRHLRATMSGICWSPDGSRVLWSVDDGKTRSIVLQARWSASGEATLLPEKALFFQGQKKPNGRSLSAIPNEMLVRGNYLFVVLNGNNEVVKLDLSRSNTVVWRTKVGVAPYGLAFADGKLYVTNWGGRHPKPGDVTAGTPWDPAVVDSVTGAVNNGTVSVVSVTTGDVVTEIPVGLHPNDVVASPDERFVYVANGNSDNVSVIDTRTNQVVETISVRLLTTSDHLIGDSPNAVEISPDGTTLYVANGMDNAVAVVRLGRRACTSATPSESKVLGFIPTEAYPTGLAVSKDGRTLYVANLEAIGPRATVPKGTNDPDFKMKGPRGRIISTAGAFNAHRQMASVSIVRVPAAVTLARYTSRVRANNLAFRAELAESLPRRTVPPVPVPERLGEPSVFKHVLYIIKENRTYDQILGDMPEGNGDSSLCVFGEEVTPNHHQLAREFLLLDNYHASGKSSSEGHQWTDSGIVTDYIEKNVRGWFRSYDHVPYDALVYPRYGFIWNNALLHGKRVRIYGEACFVDWDHDRWPHWSDIYNDFISGQNAFTFKNFSTIDLVNDLLSPNYPGYAHDIPDVLRADRFIKELHQYEQMPGDQFPELMIMALPADHTAGLRPDRPTPRACVADNDLALGRIVEALSHSRFWKNTVIFVTEDDSQNGWDHVSAYRTVGFVISAYSRLGKTVHTNYNQVSLLRTMEQILGLPPMNQLDAAAKLMTDCFTQRPDLTPYTAVTNRIPLDELNPPVQSLRGKARHFAELSLAPQFDAIDTGDDDLWNRIIWFATKGDAPYPVAYAGTDDD